MSVYVACVAIFRIQYFFDEYLRIRILVLNIFRMNETETKKISCALNSFGWTFTSELKINNWVNEQKKNWQIFSRKIVESCEFEW